ncbi:hypothetical protein [Alkalicoccus urumqiensis]|uniref:Uncharacterized protein n=1 Tax=Alkalicoccus urumqiensis TaxID=1548213 RepID=A0A2P6MJG8_ALKUR|nr:hypothetical protein [Alkalicoccus urumqiensis]PRO66417.1 hypothetical protein C6I21_03495 [Alkalicoccus urumqiensis]
MRKFLKVYAMCLLVSIVILYFLGWALQFPGVFPAVIALVFAIGITVVDGLEDRVETLERQVARLEREVKNNSA